MTGNPRLKPWRSVLYIPASKGRALEKARTLAADAIIFDLEDAVAPEEKEAARALLVETLRGGGYGPRGQLVRINGLDTPWGAADLEAVAALGPEAVLVPKVDGPDDVAEIARRLDAHPQAGATGIWAMMETPRGVMRAEEIAQAPRMAGFVMGTNDLVKELGARHVPGREPLLFSLERCLMAARIGGLVVVDGVYNAFRDEEGLRRECIQGRDMGFDGKTLVHPAQLAVANEVFAPDPQEVALARRQIEAYEAARAEGRGVAVVDGRIVENLHVETARETLARAEAIAALEAALAGRAAG